MLIKNDLSQIKTVVQEAIRPEIQALKKSMATKEEMRTLETRLKNEMKNMATKNDLKNLQIKLLEKIEESEMEIITTVDKHKEDKESVKVLQKRVERLEDNAGLPPYADQ